MKGMHQQPGRDADRVGKVLLLHFFLINLLAFFVFQTIDSLLLRGGGDGARAAARSAGTIAVYASVFLFSAVLLTTGEEWKFRRGDSRMLWLSVPVFFVCLPAEILINRFSAVFFGSMGVPDATPPLAVPASGLPLLLFLVQYVLLPALLEEGLFRYAILGRLSSYGTGAAILFSSVLFTLMHGSAVAAPTIFFLGLVFAAVTVKAGSILPAVIMHALNNAIVVWISYLEQHRGQEAMERFSSLLFDLAIGAAIGLMLSRIVRRRRGEAGRPFAIEWSALRSGIRGILRSGWMIIWLVVCTLYLLAVSLFPAYFS